MYLNTLTNTVHSVGDLAILGIPDTANFISKIVDERPVVDTCLYLVTPTGVDLQNLKTTYEVQTRHLFNVQTTLKNRLKDKRNAVEQGGIVVEGTGTKMDSTRVDGQMLHNAYVGLKNFAPETIVDYYTNSGWITITVDVLEMLFTLHSSHVEKCFNREKQISDLLDAAETSDEAIEIYNNEINNGWPTYAE